MLMPMHGDKGKGSGVWSLAVRLVLWCQFSMQMPWREAGGRSTSQKIYPGEELGSLEERCCVLPYIHLETIPQLPLGLTECLLKSESSVVHISLN